MDLEHYIDLGADFLDMDESLEHYGVKGMRWGHRHADDLTNNTTSGSRNKNLRVVETTNKNNQSTKTTQGNGGNSTNNIPTILNNTEKIIRGFYNQQLAAVDKNRRLRAGQFCASVVSKNKNTPISVIKNAFKSAGKWISNVFSKLTKKSQSKTKQKPSSNFGAGLKNIDSFVKQTLKANSGRKGRGEGLTGNLKKR